MTEYIRDDIEKSIQSLLTHTYGLKPIRVNPLAAESPSSKVYVVDLEDGRRVVAKQSLWYLGHATEPANVLERVYATASMLKEKGVPVCTAYKTIAGGYSTLHDGTPWVVLEYIEGEPFDGRDIEWENVGNALGVFHRAGLDILKEHPEAEESILREIPVEKSYEETRVMYTKLHTHIMKFRSDTPLPLLHLQERITVVDAAIAYIDTHLCPQTLTRGILHNDVNVVNSHFRSNGVLSGFIDVDQITVHPLIYDVANTISAFATDFLKNHTQQVFEDTVRTFLVAYQTRVHLPRVEFESVLAASLRWDVMRILRITRRHIDGNHPFPNPTEKITKRFLPRIETSPQIFSFLTKDWIHANIPE